MIAYFTSTMTWRELLSRTVKETIEDDGLGLAAQLAYYFFLALFPALLCLLALASFFPLGEFSDMLPTMLGRFAAPELVSVIRTQIEQISNAGNGGLLSIGLLGALWSSSAALVSIIGALNRAYDITESRPWWKVRLLAIALTLGLSFFVLISFTLVLAGPALADTVAGWAGLGPAFVWLWPLLQWPLAFALICLGVGLVYYIAPDAEQEWVWVTPGSVAATVLWLTASLMFRVYVVAFGNYQQTYGAIGGVIVLLLWFYLSGLAIVVGAEINAEIEHASPWGKDPGERTPTARKKLGAAAARAYRSALSNAAHPGATLQGVSPRPRRLAPTHARSGDAIVDRAIAFVLRLAWPRLRKPH